MYQIYQFSDGSFLAANGMTTKLAQALVGSPQKLAAANYRRKRLAQWQVQCRDRFPSGVVESAEAALALTHEKREVIFFLKDEQVPDLRWLAAHVPVEFLSPEKLHGKTLIPYQADVQERLNLLDALEAEGVDNWDGYGYAVRRAAGEEED